MLLRNALLLCMAYQCYFAKETETHGSHSLFQRILHRHKRPNSHGEQQEQKNGNNNLKSDGISTSTCSPSTFSPHVDMIIKSTASIDNGAKYLNAHNVTSGNECFDWCCRSSDCDTAIFEDKNDHQCYLFDCRGRCQFKPHDGYAVWDLERHVKIPTPPKEEEELAQLHDNKETINKVDHDDQGSSFTPDHRTYQNHLDSNSESNGNDNDNAPDSSDQSSQPEQASNQKYIAPHTAGISETCVSDISCEDPNAVCMGDTCHCKNGFYNRNGLCRKVCSKSQFECIALGTSGRGPECISQSQVCDSYMQCADGSDELNCHNQDDQGSNHHVSNTNTGLSDINRKGIHPTVSKTNADQRLPHKTVKGSTAAADSKFQRSTPKPVPLKPSVPKVNKNETQSLKTAKDNKLTKTLPTTKKTHSSLNSKLFVSQEKVIIASSTSEAEGPIIALSLGLAFTLILVGLLVCRLRNMKYRLRKGRPLSSNEADYLINGMYL